VWNLIRDAPCRLSAHGVSSSITWRQTVMLLPFAPIVLTNCSWQCDRRFEPNFVPACALCKMGDHGSKYRGCPYFRTLMEKVSRNKPQSATLNIKQLNPKPPNKDRRQTSFQSIHQHRPPFNTLQDYHPTTNAWTIPLNFSGQPQLPPRPFSYNQPRDLPSNYSFVPHPHSAHLHYKADPPLPHKVSCPCSLNFNLSANKGSQPSARNPGNCENGIFSPVQNIPASPRPPETGGESHSDGSATNKSPRPQGDQNKAKTRQNTFQRRTRIPFCHAWKFSFQATPHSGRSTSG
jgi:hypothetical protein